MRAKDKILEEAAAGRLGFVEAVAELAAASGAVGELKEAKIDHAREARCGFPEFVYGAGKSLEQLLEIIPEIHGRTGSVLVTRLPAETGSALVQAFPAGEYDPAARTFRIRDPERRLTGKVLVVTAGSSDHGVAKEALHTLEACGIGAELVADVGVAGIERLFASLDRLRSADVCIVVAGMEGALPECGRRSRPLSGDRGADQCGLRCRVRGRRGAARDVEQLCIGRDRRQHRQRVRCGLRCGENDQSKQINEHIYGCRKWKVIRNIAIRSR